MSALWKSWAAALIAAFPFAQAVLGQEEDAERLVADAQAQFENGKRMAEKDPDGSRKVFRAAGEGFALAAQLAGDRGAAHYNAGNAFTFSGDIGEAIFHYRMAQTYHPFDPNIAHNLNNARGLTLDSVAEEPTRSLVDLGARGVRFVRAKWRAALFVLGYAALFGLLIAAFAWGRSALRRKAAWACGIVVVVAGASLLVEWWVCQGGREGVVVAEEVVARTGDGRVYPTAFSNPLHAGVEFRLRERRGDWVRAMLWNGEEGWIPVSGVRIIGAK